MEFYEKQYFKTLEWFFCAIILPLTPFFLAALIQIIYFEKISFSMFDPSILSFTMIMVCYVTLVKIHNLDNTGLKSFLTTVYYLLIAFLFVPFVMSIFFRVQQENYFNLLIQDLKNSTVDSQIMTQQLNTISIATVQYQNHIEFIRFVVVFLAALTIFVAVICKWKWKVGSGIYGE
jgi:hypothetical protein